MEVELFAGEETTETASLRKAIIATNSLSARETIAELLEAQKFSCVKYDNGYTALKTYKKSFPELLVFDLDLKSLHGKEFLKETGRLNQEKKTVSRLIIISPDNKKETILELLTILKSYKAYIKLGFLVAPWQKIDFLNSLKKLYEDDELLTQSIETKINNQLEETAEKPVPERLLLSITEIPEGLRIELGCDHDLSVNGANAKEYIEQIEISIFMIPVEAIEFSLASTVNQNSSDVLALLLLINGLAEKHQRKISFVDIPFGIYQEIEKHGLKKMLKI